MNRLSIAILVLAIVAAACSSDSGEEAATTTTAVEQQASATTTTSGDTTSGDATTTTTAAATTTTQAPTTTESAATDLASCVVGTWELDSQAFFDTLSEFSTEGDDLGTLTFVDGAYLLIVEADGTFQSVREDWTFAVEADGETIELRMNDVQTGTYTFDGSVLSTTLEGGSPAEIEILIDGVPFELPGGRTPIEPPAAEFEGALVTCDGDVMGSTSEADPFGATWRRVG